mmetsp:Transcript_33904/g.76765  ORF Transcript_33904/g.76765 Transcript_33904/m.76765 type:complete len:312 (-) Transcript_33904:482-1417(-)
MVAHFPFARAWRLQPSLLTCLPYSAVALLLTWRLILCFMVAWQDAYAKHPDPPNLFVEAYALVCDSASGWWWSSNLLTWVTVACPLAATEACARRMSPRLQLAHITTAFLGAVSLAFPVLLAHLALLPAREGVRRSPTNVSKSWLWPICVACSLLSIVLLPATVGAFRGAFIGGLVVVHLVLLVPFVAGGHESGSFNRTGYLWLALLTFLLHVKASAYAFDELSLAAEESDGMGYRMFASGLLVAFSRNVCQTSIAIDAVLSALAGFCYMVQSSGWRGLLFCVAAPIISPAAALALHAATQAAVIDKTAKD